MSASEEEPLQKEQSFLQRIGNSLKAIDKYGKPISLNYGAH